MIHCKADPVVGENAAKPGDKKRRRECDDEKYGMERSQIHMRIITWFDLPRLTFEPYTNLENAARLRA